MLACRDLDAGYGSLVIVRGLDLTLDRGRVLAVLGPNGAGKTTLLLTLAGLLPRIGGDVSIDGTSLPSGKPNAASKAGLVLVPDDRALFCTLTVEENLKAARAPKSDHDEVVDLFPALRDRWRVDAGSLSGGEQQMLVLARALVQQPRVLLIDEMSMGLAPVIVEQLMPIVRQIASETNTVVVLVEQHVRLALEVADEAIVLAHGRIALSGAASELAADLGRLEAAYLGDAGGAAAAPNETGAVRPRRA
jgi:branched-chain amino acid transport system ATP-binding protein